MASRARLLRAADSILVLVDLQDRLLQAMAGAVTARAVLLARAAELLDVPVIATRQNPTALGALAPELIAVLPKTTPIWDKTAFSCTDVPGLMGFVMASGRKQLVLAGVETHVCILQSAFGFLDSGFGVAVVTDAVASRKEADRVAALGRMTQAGIAQATVESVVFEWLRNAAHPQFRAVLALVK